MKKVLVISLIAAATIQAAEPMVPESMSTDRGGVKSAIDAYSDGGGAYLYDNKGRAAYDNSPMNNLVFKYGAAAKESSVSLRNQVKTLSQSTTEEKLLADKIPASSTSINPPQDGTVCNDFNPNTSDDKFVNGVCIGTDTVFTSCKDILDRGASTGSGVYIIDPDREGAITPFNVYCDMTTDGGGWTLVGNQVPSSLYPDDIITNDINVNNFGNINSTYRLGNIKIQQFIPTVGWRIQAVEASGNVKYKAYVKNTCVIDWANNIEDIFPTYDSAANFSKSCGIMYSDIGMISQYTKILNSAAMGIGSNNAGQNCSMRFAGIPKKYCPSGSSCYGSMGWAQPCVTSEYSILTMRLWVK